MAAIQHTLEQYGLPTVSSLEPTHWIKATRFASCPSKGRTNRPCVGPDAFSICSSSMLVMTFFTMPYPYSGFFDASKRW